MVPTFICIQMCQHDLLAEGRDVSLGSVSQVEWDGTSDKSFVITYKGGDAVNDKQERYVGVLHGMRIKRCTTCDQMYCFDVSKSFV